MERCALFRLLWRMVSCYPNWYPWPAGIPRQLVSLSCWYPSAAGIPRQLVSLSSRYPSAARIPWQLVSLSSRYPSAAGIPRQLVSLESWCSHSEESEINDGYLSNGFPPFRWLIIGDNVWPILSTWCPFTLGASIIQWMGTSLFMCINWAYSYWSYGKNIVLQFTVIMNDI